MIEQTEVTLTNNELGLLLQWMYRAQAIGPAASLIMKKLHEAKKKLKDLATISSLPTAICAVIINPDTDQILMVSRKDNPTDFGLPGGKIDQGEEPKEALCREVREETGLIVSPENINKVYETICKKITELGSDYYVYSYYVTSFSGKLETKEQGIVKWGSWDELLRGSFFEYNSGLEKVLSKMDYGHNP